MTSIPTFEDFERLEKKINDLTTLVTLFAQSVGSTKVVNVADICKFESVSKAQIWNKEKYLLPNFGVSEYPEGTTRWNLTTYLKWREIPVKTRKDMYVDYLEDIRKRNLKECG